MARSSESVGNRSSKDARKGTTTVAPGARSRQVAERGIVNAGQFVDCMSGLMADLLTERVPVNVGNAVCSAGRNMLAAVALQMKVTGRVNPQTPKRNQFLLTSDR